MGMKQEESIIYDTHEAVRDLTVAGMPEPQAEAVVRGQAHLLEHNLASKADIGNLQLTFKADIENLRLKLKADIDNVQLKLKADIDNVQLKLKADIDNVQLKLEADIEKLRLQTKADIERSKVDLIKWVAGLNLATASLLLAAIKFL